jgi:hypothetical protein
MKQAISKIKFQIAMTNNQSNCQAGQASSRQELRIEN